MNTEAHIRRIAGEFDLPGAITTVRAHGSGLINDTYLVETADGQRLILQRINTRVFPHPEQILGQQDDVALPWWALPNARGRTSPKPATTRRYQRRACSSRRYLRSAYAHR